MKLPYTIELRGDDYFVDGKQVEDRVSKILKITKQSDSYEGVDPYYSDMGKASAKAIELHLKGTLDEESVDVDVQPRLAAWRLFEQKENYRPIHCELSLFDEDDNYCGTMDHYGELNGKCGIIDTKCTDYQKKWWKKQLHFYKRLAEKNKVGPVEWLASLMLKRDGSYELTPWNTEPSNLVDAIITLYRNEIMEDKRRKHG